MTEILSGDVSVIMGRNDFCRNPRKEVKKHIPPQRGARDGRKGAGRDQREATGRVRALSSLELSQSPRKCCLLKSAFMEDV